MRRCRVYAHVCLFMLCFRVRTHVMLSHAHISSAASTVGNRSGSVLVLTSMAAIAQLGERQTEDLKVPGWIPGLGFCLQQRLTVSQARQSEVSPRRPAPARCFVTAPKDVLTAWLASAP